MNNLVITLIFILLNTLVNCNTIAHLQMSLDGAGFHR